MMDDEWHFSVDLPQPWAVSDGTAQERLSLFDRSPDVGSAVRAALAEEKQVGSPDLVASMLQFVADESGDVAAVLMASCTIWIYRVSDLSGPIAEQQSVARDVQLTPGVGADFYELTVPVTSSDGELVALLAFSTPNVPLADDLAQNFRAIAATARFERAA
jgi:hypothetical protein